MQQTEVHYQENLQPNRDELHAFFEAAFQELSDSSNFTVDQNQRLDEWFSVDEMLNYLPHGSLIEARLNNGTLVGAIFIGKQNPISWPDGRKMELFILGVHKQHRMHDIARKLIALSEAYTKKAGSKKIIVNTHALMENIHSFYKKLGYEEMGKLTNYYDNGNAAFFQKIIKSD